MKKGIFSLMMALLFAFTGVLRADELTVYDGTTSTNYLPLYGYYADAYTRSQYVIPAADLSVMTGTQITGLRYYTSNTADWGVDYYVYLAEVSNTTLSGLIDRSAATVVYTGHLAAANGGMTISFDTPYTYNGGNLLIGMDNLSQGTYISCYWVATAVTNAGYYGYSYSSPTIMSSAASNSYIPKTTFTYYSDVTDIQLTLTPDPVDFGARPNNCWMRPMVATLSNEGPRAGIYGVDVDNNYFVPEELEIPFTLAGDESVDLHFGWTSAPEGEVTGTLVIDGQSRDAFLFDMTAYAYEPVEPDVWEMARVISNPTDYRDTPTTVTLYNNYLLPPTDVEDGNDAVYKLTIDHDMLLEGDVFQTGTETAAENGKIAVYTQAGIDEVGGPDLENNYTGPIGGRGNRTVNELTVFDGTATNYYVPVFTYCGDRLAAAQIVIPSYELSAMTGGTITSLKFHVDHVSTGGSGMDAVWKGYVKEVNYTEMTDMEDPSTATEIFNGVVSVNDYMEMVIDFSTPYTYNGGDLLIGFDVATTFGHYRAVHFLGQNDHTNAAMYRTVPYVSPTAVNFLPKTTFTYEPASTPGSEPDHLLNVTMVPGTYYIAASSTEDAWDVVLNASELPCPEVAYSPIPNDDADNLTPSAVTLRWRLGQYATEYRLLFGTTYYCENVLVDWTTDLAESYTVTNLFNNTNYFWRIEERNDGCPQGIQGPVWGFTTTFNAPTNLHATNANGTNIYEGETLHLAWNAIQDRTFRSYNVYMDGDLIGSTPSNPNPATTTTFDVEGLTYNMGGHVFNVTAVYDEGESPFSNELVINVSGEGEIDGYVYEQDGVTGIAGATVTMNGIDEFGRFHTYTFTTDANGHYHGSMFAGSYYGTASCQGYQEVAYENNPFEIVYGEVTPDINYVMDEVFTPVGEVIAEYYPDPEDPESPYVKVYWGWNIMSAMIEDFETGDFSQYDWNIPAQYPFEITTNNPYEGAYCMQSTNHNVASSTSSIDVTVEIPRDGLMSFYKRISCESSWDMAYFYIDGAQVATFTGTSGWGVKEVAITEGTHNFKWAYTKDSSVDSGEDRFFIDYIDFIHDAQPAQPGWHTYAEGEFDNALGSNLTTTPSWGYMYPNGGGYAGMRLTKVALFSDNQYTAVGGNYTCTIYTGGATPDQGTPVSTMTVDVPSNQNAWVEYDLSTPVAVSGNENLWVIWTCNTCVSSWPAGLAAGSEANGSWWNGGEGWEQVVDSYGVFTMKNYFTNRSGRTVEATYADNKTVNQPIQVAPFAQATGNHVENATTVANPNLERVATANANDRSFQYFRVYRTDCYNDGPYTEENTVVCCCELHDTAYIDVEWPDLAPGVYKWGVGCVYGGNRESEIAWSEPAVVPAQGQAAEATRDIIEIGNGTSSSYITPYNSLWGYSVVEQIYTAAEIGTSGTINSISFYMDPANTSNAAQTNSVDVFMKNVTRSDFTEGYEPLAATDMVFSGTVTFNLGWTTITLDNPFQYTGYSNLMIALHEYTPGYSTRYFCYTDADDAVISFHSDSANPDPYNLGSFSGTNYLSNYRPNIQIDITAVTPYNNDPIQEERESPIVWSNCLDKDMYLTDGAVDVTVLLNSADSPEGTTVSFRNLNEAEQELYPVAPVVLDSTGYYAWDNFRRGEYEINVAMSGYEPITTEVSIQDATSLRYVMIEIIYGVSDLYVSHTGWAMWGGDGPVPPHGDGDTFTEDFEGGLGIFTSIDQDGDGYGWRANTQLSGLTGGHNSNNFVLSQSFDNNYGALYPDNYLVSPQVNLVNGSTFSFWACAQDESWASEHFGVYVSDNGTSDWNMVQEWTLTAKGARHDGERGLRQGSWHQYSVDLSAFAGQKYIAIRHFNTTDMFYIDVDDAELTNGAKSDERHLESYKVLCTSIDGEPIFSGNTVHPFIQLPTETLIEGERYLCKVAAIYSTGTSDWTAAEWQYRACENYEGVQSLEGETGNDGNEITWTYPNGSPIPPHGDGDEFTVDFEGGLPAGWNVIDGNNDGLTWCLTSAVPTTWTYYASLTLDWYRNGTNAICSGSYVNGFGAANPDEYLVSPQVTIANGSQFSFWAAATDASYPADHFGVFVSDNGTSDWTMVNEWTLTAKGNYKAGDRASRDGEGLRLGTWYNYTVDLSAFAGQKYIAIRHFNCYDQYIMCVDDIELTAGAKSNRDEYIQYCTETYDGAVGTGGGQVWWANVFTPAQLSAYDGQSITKIGQWVSDDDEYGNNYDGTYNVEVYVGGSTSAPGTLVASGSQYITGDNDWHDIELNSAVTIDASQNIWVVFNANGIGYPMCGCAYVGEPNSDLLSTDGNTWEHAAGDYGLSYSWMIRAFVTGGSPVPPTPVGNFVGAMIFRDGEWLAQVDGNTTSYIDEDEYGTHEYCVRVIYDGPANLPDNNEYYSMSCPTCVIINGDITCEPGDPIRGEYVWNNASDFGALISWGEQAVPVAEWLYYDNGVNEDAIGLTAGGSFYWGIMIPASQLGAYNGCSLTKVSLFDYEAHSGKALIYMGGTSAPGTLVYQQAYTMTGSMDYVEVNLGAPVALDVTQNLWIIFNNDNGQYVASCCSDTGDANGRWISLDGAAWDDVAALGLPDTWQIRGYVTNMAKGTPATAIEAPALNGTPDGVLARAGVSTQGNRPAFASRAAEIVKYNVYRSSDNVNYELIGSVDAIDGTNYYEYYDATAAGMYYYQVRALYSNGCESEPAASEANPANNYVIVVVTSVAENGEIALYPNPTNGNITIQAQNMNRITVVSVLGQVVYDAEVEGDQQIINMAQFNAGVYMVRIATENGVSTQRVTVVK